MTDSKYKDKDLDAPLESVGSPKPVNTDPNKGYYRVGKNVYKKKKKKKDTSFRRKPDADTR